MTTPCDAFVPRGYGAAMVDEGVFVHSVASGDPLADRVVLWTRVTTDGPGPVETTWTVARDRELTDVVTSGTAVADPDRDFTVHVDADGLSPETTYYYAFDALGERSPVGRTQTLPGKGAEASALRHGLVCELQRRLLQRIRAHGGAR